MLAVPIKVLTRNFFRPPSNIFYVSMTSNPSIPIVEVELVVMDFVTIIDSVLPMTLHLPTFIMSVVDLFMTPTSLSVTCIAEPMDHLLWFASHMDFCKPLTLWDRTLVRTATFHSLADSILMPM